MTKSPGPDRPRRSRRRRALHITAWAIGVPVVLLAVIWLVLLVRPIPLPFVSDQARATVMGSLPDSMDIELGDTYLALENAFAPVIRFSPVTLSDSASNAHVEMEALEIGFSPIRALLGQPGAVITMVRPKLQVIQDLLGPRLGRFDIVDDPEGGMPTVEILDGNEPSPNIGISAQGLDVRGGMGLPVRFRSDNDWLVYNLAASEGGMRSIVKNADAGLFSRLIVRHGQLEMHDVVYGLVRTFSDMNLDIAPDPVSGDINGDYSAVIAGQRMTGEVRRFKDDEGGVHMWSKIDHADFSSFVPFMDDPDAMTALRGTGGVVANINFAAGDDIKVLGGQFSIDLAGTQLRLQDDYFPVRRAKFEVVWDAQTARFDLNEGDFAAGNSSAGLTGTFLLGIDDTYGPTVRMSLTAKNVYLHPNDLNAPQAPIDEMYFEGWSAPLYGALGIDRMVAKRGDMQLLTTGRADMLRKGVGFDMNVVMEGATADDLKRLWPYMMAPQTRTWFVSHVLDGTVDNASMSFHFPIGAVGQPGEDPHLPEGSTNIGMTAENVEFVPFDGLPPILAEGTTRLDVNNGDTKINFGNAALKTDGGNLIFANTGFSILEGDEPDTSKFVLDGDVSGPFSAALALANHFSPDMLSNADLPFPISALSGDLDTHLNLSVGLKGDDNERTSLDYALTGKVTDFASAEPIEGHKLSNGDLAVSVNKDGYAIEGPAEIDGLDTNLSLSGQLGAGAEPQVAISSTFTPDDLKQFGFDVGDVLGGKVGFKASPAADGGLKIDVDLADASLDVADLGLKKSRGESGSLTAIARFDGNDIDISGVDLGFGSVRLQGSLKYNSESGLQSADFTQFAISQGDDAQLSLVPTSGGYALTLRGKQLDMKPLLQRFFSLSGGGTGGPQATAIDQTITLNAKLDRALGFYSVTAFNLNADLTLKGKDLSNVALQANFGSNSSVSVTTNPAQGGRTMTVAFNDLGTLLRFGNVYSRIAGGSGSLVLTTNTASQTDHGELGVQDFAIVDEDNVAQILGNHDDSRQLIARQNRLDFDSAKASFIRHPDRIEITDALLDGRTMGGTARGFIYTDQGQYDLSGTYVPLFGLNNAFQQIPILGPLLGGREGEGLIGVTFAVRGPLDNPRFLVNPASLLLPGAFRSLMEFRSHERPQAQQQGGGDG